MRAILRDAASGTWRLFERPRELVVARQVDEVIPALRKIESECAQGAFAAGFIAYEAAPAFDRAFRTRVADIFPLVWFGLYDNFHDLPQESVEEAESDVGQAAWSASITPEHYQEVFDQLQELIRAGQTYQVNFTYRLRAAISSSPWALFQHLVSAQEAPFAAYLHAGEWIICSASPELFFEKNGPAIVSRPMKGTAARGLWFEQDLEQAHRLSHSEKERAENVMIVDMVRNDLGRIARPGTVTVSKLFDVERYPTVWQMTSTVSAETGSSLTEIITALFPPASITGAPKAAAMEIIADLECSPRRIYTGTVGFIEPGGRAQFNVAIRTVLLNRKTEQAEYGVGGGIVSDSNANQEMAEAQLKSKVLGPGPPRFELLETILWKPGEGYLLLDRHLKRLLESAQYFSFQIDVSAIERQLRDLAGTLAGPHRIRVLVSRKGAVDVKATPQHPEAQEFADVALAADPVDAADRFLYHKTTNRGVYEAALASRPGMQDVLLFNDRNEITESTMANLIVEVGGELFTPPIECGLLPGTARAQLLEQGRVRERKITVEELRASGRLYLINSVRGMHPVSVTNSSASERGCKQPLDAAGWSIGLAKAENTNK